MTVSIDDQGGFARLARDLDAAKKDLRSGSRDAFEESESMVQRAVRSRALATLPGRGGLARLVARTKVKVQVKDGGSNIEAKFTGTGPVSLRGIDAGRVVHPLFGNRSVRVRQRVKAGFWSDSIEELEPKFYRELDGKVGKAVEQRLD